MTVNLTQGDTVIPGKVLASLEYSTDSGKTWTLAQSAQTDVVTVGYCVDLNITAMVNVPANSLWHVTIYHATAGNQYLHFNSASVSIWSIYRVG